MEETTQLRGRGRPKGAESTHVMIRMPNDLLTQIDDYAKTLEAQIGISDVTVSRAMAIRELCKKGLQSLQAVSQPTSASPTNGTGAPAPAPTTQPAIPLALEPAPTTAEPVDVPQVSETPTESQNGEPAIPPYDTSKYILGKLCPRGHDYHGTGQSLRHRRRHVCLACDAEQQRERRKAKAQGQPA